MVAEITQIEGWLLEAKAEGFKVVSSKRDKKGAPEGLSPGRLMAASLGLCTGMHLVSYPRKKGLPHRFKIRVSQGNPSRCSKFHLEVELGQPLGPQEAEELLEEASKCYVANTLLGKPEIELSLTPTP